MSSLTIYLEDTLEARLRETAQREGVSVSKLVARYVAERTAASWPEPIVALAGSWPDAERPRLPADAPRAAW
jgi:hypothetical protein